MAMALFNSNASVIINYRNVHCSMRHFRQFGGKRLLLWKKSEAEHKMTTTVSWN